MPRIWQETKVFEYAHCIDISDRNSLSFTDYTVTKINLQIRFADKDTERAYEEHVDTLLKELPDYCKNGEKIVHKCIELAGKPKTFLLIRKQEILKYALSIFPVSLVTLPVFYLMLISGFLHKVSYKFNIQKEITSNNDLQIII